MTVENTPAGSPPAVTPPPAAPPPTPPSPAPSAAPAVPPPPAPSGMSEATLNERIAQAKRSAERETLQAIGVESVDAAKARIASAKAAEDANKTELQKTQERVKTLEPEAAKAKEQAAVLTEYAARMMAGLTPEQTAAVKAIAGDDPTSQLKTITALAPTWAKAAAPGAPGSPPAPAPAPALGAPPPPPVTTAPPAGAPSGGVPAAGSVRALYEAARAQNPFAAAAFGLAHDADVYAPKP